MASAVVLITPDSLSQDPIFRGKLSVTQNRKWRFRLQISWLKCEAIAGWDIITADAHRRCACTQAPFLVENKDAVMPVWFGEFGNV